MNLVFKDFGVDILNWVLSLNPSQKTAKLNTEEQEKNSEGKCGTLTGNQRLGCRAGLHARKSGDKRKLGTKKKHPIMKTRQRDPDRTKSTGR
jgi:hypothetical protein